MKDVARCPECDTVTPHLVLGRPWKRLLAWTLVALGASLLAFGTGELPYVGLVVLYVALNLYLGSRRDPHSIGCVRCRTKHREKHRIKGPSLDGNSEINLLG